MSHRITWRSRPRSQYPWPVRTLPSTLAALYAGGGLVPGFIGPLPLPAAVELLFRVKKLAWSAAITVPDQTPAESAADGDLVYDSGVTESDVFAATGYRPDLDDGQSLDLTSAGGTGYGWAKFINTGSAISILTENAEIFRDENGDFWLSGGIEVGGNADYVFSIGTIDAGGSYLLFDIDLVLSTGTHQIQGIATTFAGSSVTAAALTLTATEWFPFRTAAGDPAWNTATGAPINGGPGA